MREISQTKSFCAVCGKIISARIIEKQGCIKMEKTCLEHGDQEALISSDPNWFYRTMAFSRPEETPPSKKNPSQKECPLNCGFCEDHAQKMYLPVVPITSACNLNCPVCYTINKNKNPFHMEKDAFAAILEQLRTDHPEMQIINFTGGEPLVHPHFCDLVEMCRDAGIRRITISTNGLRFLEDESLLPRLTELDARIVLSFNSFHPEPYTATAGKDLLEKKLKILELLETHKPSTTLLSVAAAGINDKEIGKIVRYVLESDFIVSSEIHTVTFTGQSTDRFDRATRLTTPDVISNILEHNPSIRMNDFLPSACTHPLCYSICYLLTLADKSTVPFTRFMGESDVRRMSSGSLYMEPSVKTEEILTDVVNDLWAREHPTEQDTMILSELKQLLNRMFPPQKTDFKTQQRMAENAIKAIYIHSHMDADNFDGDRVKHCCVAVPDGKGGNIPTCAYNTVYRALDPNFSNPQRLA